jgi:hypothetical protein
MTLLPLSRTPFVPFAPARERSSCTHARLVAARSGCRDAPIENEAGFCHEILHDIAIAVDLTQPVLAFAM